MKTLEQLISWGFGSLLSSSNMGDSKEYYYNIEGM